MSGLIPNRLGSGGLKLGGGLNEVSSFTSSLLVVPVEEGVSEVAVMIEIDLLGVLLLHGIERKAARGWWKLRTTAMAENQSAN